VAENIVVLRQPPENWRVSRHGAVRFDCGAREAGKPGTAPAGAKDGAPGVVDFVNIWATARTGGSAARAQACP
jgi:hypothetical protein